MRAVECSTKALRRMTGIATPTGPSTPKCGRIGENGGMSKKTDKDKANGGGTIALNKRARHEYHFEQKFGAGLSLQGWELKSIRAGRANLTDGYAVVLHGELFLVGAQITPLIQASTHVAANDRRSRKLLLHRHEIDELIGRVQRDGYTLVPTALYWNCLLYTSRCV